MLLDCASGNCSNAGHDAGQAGGVQSLDWHGERGLSFLQLGLRELALL